MLSQTSVKLFCLIKGDIILLFLLKSDTTCNLDKHPIEMHQKSHVKDLIIQLLKCLKNKNFPTKNYSESRLTKKTESLCWAKLNCLMSFSIVLARTFCLFFLLELKTF